MSVAVVLVCPVCRLHLPLTTLEEFTAARAHVEQEQAHLDPHDLALTWSDVEPDLEPPC